MLYTNTQCDECILQEGAPMFKYGLLSELVFTVNTLIHWIMDNSIDMCSLTY